MLCDSYRVFIAHFTSILDPSQAKKPSATLAGRAKNILKFLKSYKDVQFAHFMVDVFTPLAVLSKEFQKDHVTPEEALAAYEKCSLSLIELQTTVGPYQHKVIQAMAQKGEYTGQELQGFSTDTLLSTRELITGKV